MQKSQDVLYICPECFQVSETPREPGQHHYLICHPGPWGDARRKPLTDAYGNYVSRAPRWYLEANGLIPSWTPVTWNPSHTQLH